MTDSALSPGPARMVTGLFTSKESAQSGYRFAQLCGSGASVFISNAVWLYADVSA